MLSKRIINLRFSEFYFILVFHHNIKVKELTF